MVMVETSIPGVVGSTVNWKLAVLPIAVQLYSLESDSSTEHNSSTEAVKVIELFIRMVLVIYTLSS